MGYATDNKLYLIFEKDGKFEDYKKYISKWDVTKFEGVWFSFFWIALLPLYGVRKIQEIFQKL